MTDQAPKQISNKESRLRNLRKKEEEILYDYNRFERKKQPFYLLIIILFILAATSLSEPALSLGILGLAGIGLWAYKEPEQIEVGRKLREVREKIYAAEEDS